MPDDVVNAPETEGAPSAPETASAPTLLGGDETPQVQANEPQGGTEEPSEGTEDPSEGGIEYEFETPEGFEAFDEALAAKFVDIAAEVNLPNDVAQKMVDLYAQELTAQHEAEMEDWDNTLNEWKNESMKDTEIGGSQLETSVNDARVALNTFGTSEIKNILEDTGLGNHPEVIRMLAKIGKAVRSDNFEFGRSSEPQKTAAQLLFPTMAA